MTPYKIVKTFVDDRDCGAKLGLPEYNQLKVKTVNNGTANYIVIETARWALDEDSLNKLYNVLNSILKEAN